MKLKSRYWLLGCIICLLAGCSTPSRTENGVTIDDGKYKNIFQWMGNAMSNE